MKKFKIKGISSCPLFIRKLRGYMDRRKGAVAEGDSEENKSKGHYIENLLAAFNTFVHSTYKTLETQTSELHKNSARLVIEYEDIQEQLLAPDEIAGGTTASMRARDAIRISAIKPRLKSRLQEIRLELASIDEDLSKAANEAAAIERQASALTARHIQAYLHGASLAAKRPLANTHFEVVSEFEEEDNYLSRHRENDLARKAVLNTVKEGV